jgi:hypothetical protein
MFEKIMKVVETQIRPRHKLLMLRHNMIAHPIAGLCWLFNLEKAGDYVHNNW